MTRKPVGPAFQMNTRDGFYVHGWREHGSMWLSAGHWTVIGGLLTEWSDGDRYPGDTDGNEGHRLVRNQARRMLRRARVMMAEKD